ncbi:MAG: Formate hydrogenlyase transcriptional activator [Bryobacterales bacterium]|nr:Formate hydrogenlyase transcriptional activator [Bryobacterales bacterium]
MMLSTFQRSDSTAVANQSSDQHGIIGSSAAIRAVMTDVALVAPTDSTVLIEGETGTGKELFARAIHTLSERRGPLVTVNCAAIPASLLESELFGHERGAFTGAFTQRTGRFEAANHGTLFLDEIGDMPLELQAKLLRVLQEQSFERLGSSRTCHVDVRVIAATNRDLATMVENNEFRADLFYRLSVFPISLPPLRQRREDIPALTRYFVPKFAERLNRVVEDIPLETLAAMVAFDWPGNIRQLQNFIEHGLIISPGPVFQPDLSQLSSPVFQRDLSQLHRAPDNSAISAGTLDGATRRHILDVLRETNGVVGGADGAAARLGVARTTLIAKMKRLGIETEKRRPWKPGDFEQASATVA